MSITLHGIKNCDTVRKARKWLEANNVEYRFRDFRESEPTAAEIRGWLEQCELQQLLNKRSTTWKSLSQEQKDQADEVEAAITLLAQHPTLIKRPVLTRKGETRIGFSDAQYQNLI